MNLKQELGLYLDLWGTRKKLIVAEVESLNTAFYGNSMMMYNASMIKHDQTLPILQTLDPQDESPAIEAALARLNAIDGESLDKFKGYRSMNKTDYVSFNRKGIALKTFKAIRKMLDDYEKVEFKCEEFFVFYANGTPMVIVSPVELDIQTSLIPEEV